MSVRFRGAWPAIACLLSWFLVIVCDSQLCTTSGGYAKENTECVFPFTYTNPKAKTSRIIKSCMDFNSGMKPYLVPKQPPHLPAYPDLTSSWCATTAKYSPLNQKTRKSWGYCNCELKPAYDGSACQKGEQDVPCSFTSACSDQWRYSEAEDFCRKNGARLCSVTELVDFKMRTEACPKDDASVWTLDGCIELSVINNPKYVVSGGGKPGSAVCTETISGQKHAGVRCCMYPKVEKRARNVLLIIGDDLRPDLMSAYGRKLSVTPALDKFARDMNTLTFQRAYANYPQCVPSRLSFMTGLSPDTTGPMRASEFIKQRSADNVVISELFRKNGFNTFGGGKVFHEDEEFLKFPTIWNLTYDPFKNQYTFGGGCQNPKAQPLLLSNGQSAAGGLLCQSSASPDSFIDFVLESKASKVLTEAARHPDKPFILAVGFYKPHLPLIIHSRYWAAQPAATPDDPTSGPQPQSSYFPVFNNADSALSVHGGVSSPWSPVKSDFVDVVRKAYAAGVTQTDSRIQVILDRLDQLNLKNHTLVVVFGDNGFFLGEDGLWNKDTLFELALRVPLLVRVPWLNPDPKRKPNSVRRASETFFELLDLYRTLAGLMGLSNMVPANIQGRDQSRYIVSQLEGSPAPVTYPEAFAQVRRCGKVGKTGAITNVECDVDLNGRDLLWMGYSIRTTSWRYNVWLNSPGGKVDWGRVLAEELYDHRNDDDALFAFDTGVTYSTENRNVASSNPSITASLFQKVRAHFGPK